MADDQVNKTYDGQTKDPDLPKGEMPTAQTLKRGYSGGEKFNGSVTDGDPDAGQPTEG